MSTLTGLIQRLAVLSTTTSDPCQLVIQVDPQEDDVVPESITLSAKNGDVSVVYVRQDSDVGLLLADFIHPQLPTAQYIMSLFTVTANTVVELLVDGSIIERKPWDTILVQ